MTQPMTEFEVSCHVIPHNEQRYPTAGDWQDYMGRITIRVSHLPDHRHRKLLALHELVEALLCRWTGVDEKAVDKFDADWTIPRVLTGEQRIGEPGDDPNAPYHRQHHIATICEMLAAELLGVDWNEYNNALEELDR